jgi:hypothetical protein
MAKKKKKPLVKKPVRGRRRHSRVDAPYKESEPAHEVTEGPYVVIFVAEDKYNDVELCYWLNKQLLDGFELVGTMTVVSVKHQHACTYGTRFIFKRYAQ